MEHTANYQLSQWEKTDRIQMEDFNGDNAKVEAALTALAAKDTALQQSISAQAGRLTQKFYTDYYVGTDSSEDPYIRFPSKPLLVVLCAEKEFLIALPDSHRAYGKLLSTTSSFSSIGCTVSGSLFTWASGFCDQKNLLYHVFAILAD